MIKEQYAEKGDSFSQDTFVLSEQQRWFINKRLPVGFSLVKLDHLPFMSNFDGPIDYLGKKRDIRVANQELSKKLTFPIQVTFLASKNTKGEEKNLRLGQLPEGFSKQSQKIKQIFQKLRKHQKYVMFSQHLTNLGFSGALQQIEAQNRKNIHTIESFRQRMMYILNRAINVTYSPEKNGIIAEIIDELNYHVEGAQRSEFSSSLTNLQKHFDKITRQMREIKETGKFYFKKRKRVQKNYDQKELLQLAETIKALPPQEMVGVLQIISQRPFHELTQQKIEFDLHLLKTKKIRQIQFYVKKKMANYQSSISQKNKKRMRNRNAEIGQIQEKSIKRNADLDSFFNLQFQGRGYSSYNIKEYESVKKQQQIAYIFQEVSIQRNGSSRAVRGSSNENSSSVESQERKSQNSDDFYSEREDNINSSSQKSKSKQKKQASINDSQAVGSVLDFSQSQYLHISFEQSNAQSSKMEHNEIVEQQNYEFQSSDSSYITDEEDSDF